jgi:hypothetical protein
LSTTSRRATGARARIEREGTPPVTFAALLGNVFGPMAANQAANLTDRRIRTVMFACVARV